MAHHGTGRGGRGYPFLAAQREEGKPGHESKESCVPINDIHSLLKWQGSKFGRGSAFLGRGSGTSPGSVLAEARGKTHVELAVDDPNDNALSSKKKLLQSFSAESSASSSEPPSISEELKSLSVTDSGFVSSVGDVKQKALQKGGSGLMQSNAASKLDALHAKLGIKSTSTMGKGLFLGRGAAVVPGRGLLLCRNLPMQEQGTPENLREKHHDVPKAKSPLAIGRKAVPIESMEKEEKTRQLESSQVAGHGMKISPSRPIVPGMPSGRGIVLKRREPGVPSLIGMRSKEKEATPEFLLKKPGSLPVSAGEKVSSPELSTEDHREIAKREVIEYHGSSGLTVPIRVNCVKLKCRNEGVYQYHVSFDPDIDNRSLRYSLLNQHRELIGDTKAFDGSILYLPREIGNTNTMLVSERHMDGAKIKIKISLTSILHPASHRLLPFYNVVLHRVMKILEMCPVGRNYYDPACAQSLVKYKLHLWPGYATAIREMEGGLLMNIDTSHKVLRNETVLSLMQDIYRANKADFHGQCIKELVGATVLTRYNNNNYRVDDIDWSMTPMSTFTTSKGETITFYDYYKTQYRLEIRDLKQPMLVNRPKKATQRGKRVEMGEERVISLVPELCFLTGISDKLAGDYTAMKEIGEFTRLKPAERNLHIEKFLKRVNSSLEAKQELLRWGLELDTSCMPLNGRQLPSEKVLVGNKRIFQCSEEADFSRDVTRAPVIRSVPICNWVIVFTSRDGTKAQDFVKKFEQVSRNIGMQIRPPKYIELKDDRSDSFKNAVASVINPALQLVVCIFPTSRDDRYNAVKRLCCVDMPVPSQVILSKTLPRDPTVGKFRSVTMKIALQINCKLGGELWALSIPLDGLMVCGIDVFHEGRVGKGKSVAAFVASMNKLMTRWFSRAVVQLPQQEIIDSLKHCFCDTLTKYYEVNHKLPERIVIYRDGVGDGQLSVVAEHEVNQLLETLKMFGKIVGGEYNPKLTFVVVSKRINIRYFKEAGKFLVNPPPGTVLDHTATRPNWPDFYLVSQHVRQGTVSPTHYIAIHGSTHLKADHLQRLTYKLTHMYYNWPGTVRVPAPCQYAHKMAYLIGENVRKEPALVLCDRLFYL